MAIAVEEKTPTANALLTEAGQIIAHAKELSDRADTKANGRSPCDVAVCEAAFATRVAKHLHKLDSEWCKDHGRVNAMADDIATIKRIAKWTLGILCAVVGSGGVYQVWQLCVHLIKKFCVIAIAVGLCSCGRQEIKPLAGVDSAISAEPATLADARLSLADASAKLAEAKERVKALEKAQAQARTEAHRRTLAWATGLAILGALACGFLAVFLPVMRKRLAMAAVGCAAVIVLAQAIGAALPWLPLVGAGLALVVLAGGLYYAIRALRDSTGFADRLKAMLGLGPDDPELTTTRAEQTRRGTRRLIQATRRAGRPKGH